MINKDFFQALEDLETEKKIDKETFITTLENALTSAYKKMYGEGKSAKVVLNPSLLLYNIHLEELTPTLSCKEYALALLVVGYTIQHIGIIVGILHRQQIAAINHTLNHA